MKLILPEDIRKKIESLCKPAEHRSYFLPKDLVEPLKSFIDTKLKNYNEPLYQKYKDHRGTDERTLRFAWSNAGNKEDGAIKSLRDLLCYFGFKKNWLDTLKELGIDESEIIRMTKELQSKHGEIKNDDSNFQGKELIHFITRIYVELTTRKAAIPIDENNDVIEEIYDSWYTLFCLIREEMKLLPLKYFKNHKSLPVIELTLSILNETLRSHLTEHQAKFRQWYQQVKTKSSDKNASPQMLQRKYPAYKSLMVSIKEVNERLAAYSKELLNFIEE